MTSYGRKFFKFHIWRPFAIAFIFNLLLLSLCCWYSSGTEMLKLHLSEVDSIPHPVIFVYHLTTVPYIPVYKVIP